MHVRLWVAVMMGAAVGLFVVSGAFAEDATYVGNTQCKICHNTKDAGEMWTKWKATKHAKTFETLQGDPAKEAAKKKGVAKAPAEAPECLSCHVTAYDAAKGAAPEKITAADGVQCESCHGPASLHVADGKKFKATKDASIKMSAHIKKGDEATCKTCHNDKSPTWKGSFDFADSMKKIEHKKPAAAK